MLASLISGLASGEPLQPCAARARAAIVYALAALAALCGLGFLVGAAYVWVAGSLRADGSLPWLRGRLPADRGLLLLIHRLSAGARARRRAREAQCRHKAIGITAALAVLPALLKGKGGLGTILAPAIALAAYAIYRENTKPDADDPDAGEAK